jgi:hypothetical protein
MMSSLLGQLKLDEEEAEIGDDSVLESGEKDGEKKEGQEGEEISPEKKDGAEPAAKTPKPSVADNPEAEENKNADSVPSDAPKADK